MQLYHGQAYYKNKFPMMKELKLRCVSDGGLTPDQNSLLNSFLDLAKKDSLISSGAHFDEITDDLDSFFQKIVASARKFNLLWKTELNEWLTLKNPQRIALFDTILKGNISFLIHSLLLLLSIFFETF